MIRSQCMSEIVCGNCKTINSNLNAKCKSCGSFLQTRVPNLNLFDTMWEVIEKPKETFQKICLSEQKNYVFLLFSIAGLGLIFTAYWYAKIGEHYSNLLFLLLPALAIGPISGVLLFYLFTYLSFQISVKIFKTDVTLRNLRAVIAYSLVPIVFATIFILPVELIVFGLYFFTESPSPQLYKPLAFYVLISLDILCVLYSLVLFYKGIGVSNNFGKKKNIFAWLIFLLLLGLIIIIPMEILKLL